MQRKTIAIVVICLFATGCAGRSPNPVAVVQPTDRFMDCPAIFAEVQANNVKLQELASEFGRQGGAEYRRWRRRAGHLAGMVRDGLPGHRQHRGGCAQQPAAISRDARGGTALRRAAAISAASARSCAAVKVKAWRLMLISWTKR